MNNNDHNNVPTRLMGSARIMGVKLVLGFVCTFSAVLSFAQTDVTRTGLSVSIPNGYPNVQMDDMRVMSTAGTARWARRWSGKEWTFNSNWESLSQSWTNLTGSITGTSAAGTVTSTAPPPSDAEAGCWVWVDEDWQPQTGTTIVDDKPIGVPMDPQRIAPFNKVMGEDQDDYPAPRIVNIDYATLCRGTATLSSPVRDVEAVRLKNELYLGDNGRYAFSNRSTLEKRAVRGLPAAAAAALDNQLAAGSITLAPVAIAKGFRWMDKGGDWIDYNTQGQVVAYGDRNDNTVWMARDTGGTLRGVVDANGRVMFTLHYNGALVVEVRDYQIPNMPLDLPARSVKYGYDAAYRLTSVVDVLGNTTRYGYDVANHLTSITDQEGRIETIAYSGASVAKRTAPDGGVTDYAFEYDDVNKQFSSRITGPETAAGRRVEEFTHNRTGQLVRRTVNGRVDEEVIYDTGSRAEVHTNARGFTYRIVKNEFDQIVESTMEDGGNSKTTYSALNLNIVEEIDAVGTKSQYQYDSKGNLIKLIEAAGSPDERITEYEINSLGQRIRTIVKGRKEVDGRITADSLTTVSYDLLGRATTVMDAEGNAGSFIYDRAGNVVSSIDQLGNTTLSKLDANGQVLKETDALGRARTFTYDKVTNLVSVVDSSGRQTSYYFDSMNRLTKQVNPGNATFSFEYDKQGAIITSIDPDSRKTSFTYDIFRRPIKKIDSAGNITQYGYQIADGSTTGVLGSLSAPTETVYPTFTENTRFDPLGRAVSITRSSQNFDDRTNVITYDLAGSARSVTNAYAKNREFSYNNIGQQVGVIDMLGNQTQMRYDAHGNLIQVTDAKGQIRSFDYDRNNRVIKETLPLGQTLKTSYDKFGNISTKVDADGVKQIFAYDAANRMTQLTQFNTTNSVERTTKFSFGNNDELLAWNDTSKGVTTSSESTYDEAGRKSSEKVTYPGGYSMGYSYAYSQGGKKVKLTWADGSEISYRYNINGQLETVDIPDEGTISVTSFQWTAPASITFPGGVVQEKKYDGLLNLTSLDVKGPLKQGMLTISNSYGKMEELLENARNDNSSGSTKVSKYIYDNEIRLTRVEADGGGTPSTDIETFSLDAVANRTAHSRVSGAWLYDANNRLIQRGAGSDITSYDYNQAGNLIKKTEPGAKVTVFAYNSGGQLDSVSDDANHILARYGYDPLGRRIWKEQFADAERVPLAQPRRIYFLYGDEGLLAEAVQPITVNGEVSGPAVITTQYGVRPDSLFNSGVLFVKTRNSNDEDIYAYYHHDQLGTPVQASDRFGNIVWAAVYDAFGKAQIITPDPTKSNPTIISSLRFPGQTEDGQTGLHYNYFRDYDPQTGRYIESDPIGIAGGINTYSYVGGNPIGLTDSRGLLWDATGAYTAVAETATGLGAATGTSAAVAGAAVSGAALAGVGIGMGFNAAWEKIAGKPFGVSIYDALNHDPDLQQEMEKAANQSEAHRICDEPPPKDLDPCALARWNLTKMLRCKMARDKLSHKWFGGPDKAHEDHIKNNVDPAIERQRKAVDKICRPCP